MKSIPVDGHPFERTYDSPEAAIAEADNHPLQSKARSDGLHLLGAILVDSYWTNSEFALGFSNGQWLHVFLDNHRVRWALGETKPCILGTVEQVGSPPLKLDWGIVGEELMDRSSLVSARFGKEFVRLWVNEIGLFVYTKGQLILRFGAIFRTDTGEDILYVTETD
jgi:hypothetical protein